MHTGALVIPPPAELLRIRPAERWQLEEELDSASEALRFFNDEELRRWVEIEGKTQTEIAELVGRSQGRISQRCSRLGIVSRHTSGGQKRPSISPNTSDDDAPDTPEEPVEGEIVDTAPPEFCPNCGQMILPNSILIRR